MPQQLTEFDQADYKKVWELFLNTVKGDETIKVTNVTPKQVTFSITSLESLTDLKALLANPSELKARVLHAIGKTQGQSSSSNAQHVQNREVQSIQELMHTIFGKDFLEKVGVTNSTLSGFIDNSTTQTATLTLTGTNLEIKRDLTEFEILQSTVDQNANLTQVLNGVATFDQQTNNTPEFAQQVIQIDHGTGKVLFNYGVLLQAEQSQSYDSTSPVIAASTTHQEFSIDRGNLLKYLNELMPSGVIFKPIDGNGTQGKEVLPILFASKDNESSSVKSNLQHKFYILLDVSSSMYDNFDLYISNFQKIITQLVNKVSDWEIIISPFNDLVQHKSFSSQNKDTVDTINSYIHTLTANGNTNLNCALSESLDSLAKVTQRSTLLVFTDGANTVKQCTQNDVINSATKARAASDQFALYSMGYGTEYNATFFTNLADESGFIHMRLSDIEQIEQHFGPYIDNIDAQRFLYKFIQNEGEQFMRQVQAGDVAVAKPVPINGTEILKDGQKYTIGTISSNSSSFLDSVKDFLGSAWSYVNFNDIGVADMVLATACGYAPFLINAVSNYCVQSLGGNDSLPIDVPQV